MARLYLSAAAEARRSSAKRITPANVVEHLLHDNRFHVLFPSYDGRSIGEDCLDCAEDGGADAGALRALKMAPIAVQKGILAYLAGVGQPRARCPGPALH